MHELSLAANLVESVEEAALEYGFKEVKSVTISVGQLSCVDAEALLFALESLPDNPLLRKAEYNLEIIPGQLHCLQCNHKFPADELYTPCPNCNHYGARIIDGDQACLKALDVVPADKSEDITHV